MPTKQPFASRWATFFTCLGKAIGPEKTRRLPRVIAKNDNGSAHGPWLNLVLLRIIALLTIGFVIKKGCYSESYGSVWGTSQARE